MRRYRIPILLVILAAGLTLVVATHLPADAPKEKPAAEAPFKGKVALVYLKSDPERGAALEKASVRRLADQTFLVGVVADTGDLGEWRKGSTIWLALHDVSEIVEFKDVQEYKKAVGDPAGQ